MAEPALAIIEALLSRPPTLGTARLLAIDGPSGSGKTTLADVVTATLRRQVGSVALIRFDDLYDGWAGLDDTLAHRVLDQIVKPLVDGGSARWQVYSWVRQRFVAWRVMAPPDVLVLEGCGAGALDYAPYTTLLVWVETSCQIGTTRVAARDGPGVVEHLPDWRASEERHFAAHRTRSRADQLVET